MGAPGGSVVATSKVWNLGSTNLTVTAITSANADTTCATCSTNPLPWTIGPGQSKDIAISINTTGLLGAITREITVVSSDARIDRLGVDDKIVVTGMIGVGVPVFEVSSSFGSGTGTSVDVSGDWIVWCGALNGTSGVFANQISTSVQRAISTNTLNAQRPYVSGNLIVWNDFLDDPVNRQNWGIYGYDLSRPDLGVFTVCTNIGRGYLGGADSNLVAFTSTYEVLLDGTSERRFENLFVFQYLGNGQFSTNYSTGFTPGSGTQTRQDTSTGNFNEGMLAFGRSQWVWNPAKSKFTNSAEYVEIIDYLAGSSSPLRTAVSDPSLVAPAAHRFAYLKDNANSDALIWLWQTGGSIQQLTTNSGFDVESYWLAAGGPTGKDVVLFQYHSFDGLRYIDRENGDSETIFSMEPRAWDLRNDGYTVAWSERTNHTIRYAFLKQPDVQVSPPGIAFSQEEPVEGTPVNVSVLVRNLSGYNQSGNVTVNLYDGDPDAGGTNIATAQVFSGLAAHTDRSVVFSNITSLVEGPHNVFVKLTVSASDPANNNKAFRTLTLKDSDTQPPAISLVQVSEVSGDGDGVIGTDEDATATFAVDDQSGVASIQLLLDGVAKTVTGPLTNCSAALGKLTQGVHSLEISATDADLSPSSRTNNLSFKVVSAEKIAILYGNTAVTNGQSRPVDLGTHLLGSSPSALFILRNDGQQTLLVSELTVSGAFSAGGPSSTNVGPIGLTSFSIRPTTATVGSYTGTVTIASSDALANPFSFPVTASIIQERPRFLGIAVIGQFVQLNFSAPSNSTCRLEWSSNLNSWTLLTTLVVDGTGLAEYFTPVSTTTNQRFYRVVMQ
jgi:hypothetical protein